MNKLWIVIYAIFFSYALLTSGCGDDTTTAPEPATRLVILYAPEWDVVIPDTNVRFRWGTTSSLADSFRIEVSQDSTFNFGVFSFGLTEQEITFNPPGNNDNYFYWRVEGFWRAESDSDMSIIQKFKQQP